MAESRNSSRSPRHSMSSHQGLDVFEEEDSLLSLLRPQNTITGNSISRSSLSLSDYPPASWLQQDVDNPAGLVSGSEDGARKVRHRPHNFAAFGAKLTSSTGAFGTGIKSKMFRQSKTDLRNLKKKADMALPMADRSPRARTSKEIDRIVAMSSAPSNSASTLITEPPRKHHISFLRKDSSTVLSSSFSNSKLTSEGTLYSFHGPIIQGVDSGERPSFKTREEAQTYVTSTWSVLIPHLQNIFKEYTLRLPVEDMNILVRVHITAHVQSGGTAIDLYERFREALSNGYRSSAHKLKAIAPREIIRELALDWETSFHKIFFMLEAVFMPLQLEFEGRGVAFESADQAAVYWKSLHQLKSRLSVQELIHTVYRDRIILPLAPRLGQALLESVNFEDDGKTVSTRAAQVTQCINIVSMLRTGDQSQATVDSLVDTSRESWVSRSRLPKDRRGFVLKRPT